MIIGVISTMTTGSDKLIYQSIRSLGHRVRKIKISEELNNNDLRMDRAIFRATKNCNLDSLSQVVSYLSDYGIYSLESVDHYKEDSLSKSLASLRRLLKCVPTPAVINLTQSDFPVKRLPFPLIMKPEKGSRGHGIKTFKTAKRLNRYSEIYFSDPNNKIMFLQRLIPINFELRLLVLGDDVLGIGIKRFPERIPGFLPADNISQDVLLNCKNLAIEASKIMNLKFTGVDLIVDTNNNPWIIEVNRNPAFTTLQNLYPNKSFSDALINYVINQGE